MKKQLKRQKKWLGLPLMLTLASLSLGTQTSIQAQPYTNTVLLSQQPSNSTPRISAADLFRQAYKNRYTWNRSFPGYTAAVEFKQGKENYKGRVRVNPDLSVEVTGIDNEDARKNVEGLLRMNAVHRRQIPFEQAHKNSSFKIGTTDKSGAVEIIEQGETQASYKVLDQQVRQVNRSMGPHSVTVDTLDTEETPEGYIATRYRTTIHQPQTKQVLGYEEAEDTYKKVDGYYLLERQVVQHSEGGEQFNAEFNFTDIQLLPGKK